jgi:hypothetical protein
MKTRNQVITTRSNGLRYFDRAVEKVGRKAVLDKALAIYQRHPTVWQEFNHDWAFGNAVIEILDPPGDIQQSYNLDEALTPKEMKAFETATGKPIGKCRERKPDKAPAATVSTTTPTAPPVGPIKADSTETCKEMLEAAYAGTPAGKNKLWKRTRKFSSEGATIREFSCPSTGETALISIHPVKGAVLVKDVDPASVEKQLIYAAANIKHSGDEGQLFWNPTTRTVWWTMSDSDGGDELTDSDEIEDILAVPGVLKVVTGNEIEPEENTGFAKLEEPPGLSID